MKTKLSIILIICLLAVICATGIVFAEGTGDEGQVNGETYTLTSGEYSLKIHGENLNTSVTRGERVYESGKRFSEEDGLNETWAKLLTDGLTVEYADADSRVITRSLTRLNPTVDVTVKGSGAVIDVSLTAISIDLKLNITLDGNRLTVEVPLDGIKERSAFVLTALTVFPYFDSSYGLQEGSIFVPDGSGALIDMSSRTIATKPYSARVYGTDIGVYGDNAVKEVAGHMPVCQASMGVFGMTYADKGGFLSIIEGGAEYAEINAAVAGMTTEYNRVSARFVYRDVYFKYLDSAGKGENTVKTDINPVNLKQTFVLLDAENDSISDMATIYREYLSDKGYINTTSATGDIGLRMRFLMSESVQGFIGSSVERITGADFAKAAVDELKTKGVGKIRLSVSGALRGGESGASFSETGLASVCGSASDYKALAAVADSAYLAIDPIRARTAGGGYSSRDTAMTVSKRYVTLNNEREFALISSTANIDFYRVMTAQTSARRLASIAKTLENTAFYGCELSSIGRLLYSSYYNQVYSRNELIGLYRAMVQDGEYALAMPNDYMLSGASYVFDVESGSSGFMIEAQSVPFYQMVLSGSVEMYRDFINLDYMGYSDILKMIDYNLYPSFIMTEADSVELINTESNYIYTSRYDMWKEDILEIYTAVNFILSKVSGEKVVSREQIDELYVTKYSNGVSVAVNYGYTAVTYLGIEIPPRGAMAI